jgi:hypothetical protein
MSRWIRLSVVIRATGCCSALGRGPQRYTFTGYRYRESLAMRKVASAWCPLSLRSTGVQRSPGRRVTAGIAVGLRPESAPRLDQPGGCSPWAGDAGRK